MLVRNESQKLRNEAQVLRNESQVLKSRIQKPKKKPRPARNESQALQSEIQMLKSKKEVLKKVLFEPDESNRTDNDLFAKFDDGEMFKYGIEGVNMVIIKVIEQTMIYLQNLMMMI